MPSCLEDDKARQEITFTVARVAYKVAVRVPRLKMAHLWVAAQELGTRFTAVQISLTHTERLQPIQMQLSPISFLPNEILIHIFQCGLDEISHSAHALPLPIAMASVCRSWRIAVFCTPELWTRIFLTSVTPISHLQLYLEKSGNFEIDASFCHWPVAVRKHGHEVNSSEAFLDSIVGVLHYHGRRLRSLSLWDVSDTVVCTVMKGLLKFHAPRLASVSVKANHSAYPHYYQLRDLYLLPFVSGEAPSLTHLEIDHFPVETLRMRSDWPFNVQNLASLTLRTQECPTLGFFLPPYLIEFPALCALLRSTPNLITLALFGPIIEPDEDFPMRPPGITLPVLETLVIHRRDPGVRYHCELLSVLITPSLKHLEIPWHDDLTVELPYANFMEKYLFGDSQPRFASVRELYLHNSAAKWKMPTRSFIEAFPNLEEVVLGGTDVAKFAATLRGFVCPRPARARAGRRGLQEPESEGMLTSGAWQTVRRIVLKEPEMVGWKGWIRGFCKWLAAGGHAGQVCVEIHDGVPRKDELDDHGMMAFKRGLDRLRRHAEVIVL